MLSCLTMLSCWRCGSGNSKDRKITQHASYSILHGSKYIVPCTKRHIGKEAKSWIDALKILSIHFSTTNWELQFIDNQLTQLCSSATKTFHTTANVTSHMRNSGSKLAKCFLKHLHYFHTWSCLLPSKYKTSFKRIPQNQRCNKPQTTPTFLFGVHWTHHCWWYQC